MKMSSPCSNCSTTWRDAGLLVQRPDSHGPQRRTDNAGRRGRRFCGSELTVRSDGMVTPREWGVGGSHDRSALSAAHDGAVAGTGGGGGGGESASKSGSGRRFRTAKRSRGRPTSKSQQRAPEVDVEPSIVQAVREAEPAARQNVFPTAKSKQPIAEQLPAELDQLRAKVRAPEQAVERLSDQPTLTASAKGGSADVARGTVSATVGAAVGALVLWALSTLDETSKATTSERLGAGDDQSPSMSTAMSPRIYQRRARRRACLGRADARPSCRIYTHGVVGLRDQAQREEEFARILCIDGQCGYGPPCSLRLVRRAVTRRCAPTGPSGTFSRRDLDE